MGSKGGDPGDFLAALLRDTGAAVAQAGGSSGTGGLGAGEDADLQSLEALTKKLAEGDFGDDGAGALDSLHDGFEDDEAFRKTLMSEFERMTAAEGTVSRARLKTLYLDVMSKGGMFLRDKALSDQYIASLSPAEMAALMNLMQRDYNSIISFFDGDEDVVRAIRNVPAAPTDGTALTPDEALAGGGAGGDAARSEWDFIEREIAKLGLAGATGGGEGADGDATRASGRAFASEAVRKALDVFEGDMLHYAQTPEDLLKLCSTLPASDQNVFLDILFTEYTPEKMEARLAAQREGGAADGGGGSGAATAARAVTDLNELMDTNLVAYIFKEVLQNFRIYKKAPQRFDALTGRMNALERQAFDALVRAFWDLRPEQLRL